MSKEEEYKILVVDDEEEICLLTKSFLSKRGYKVFTAGTEAEVLNIVNKEHPQLVLLDVRLKEVSGIDVLSKIKQVDNNSKVIMVTALDDEESISKAKSQGANEYITKPFTPDYLNELIEKIR